MTDRTLRGKIDITGFGGATCHRHGHSPGQEFAMGSPAVLAASAKMPGPTRGRWPASLCTVTPSGEPSRVGASVCAVLEQSDGTPCPGAMEIRLNSGEFAA
jgi:hypothetical protein